MRSTHRRDRNHGQKDVSSQAIVSSSTASVLREGLISNSRATSSNAGNPYLRSFQFDENSGMCHSPAVIRRSHVPERSSEVAHKREGTNCVPRYAEHGKEYLRNDASCRIEDTLYEVRQMLHQERSMRLSAERRTLEEREWGARAAIVIEANYGARLLYSVFIETIAALPPTENSWLSPCRISRRRPMKSLPRAGNVNSSQRPNIMMGQQLSKSIETNKNTSDYNQLLEENYRLREEVEQYRKIDLEDRRDINELHKNMQMTIDQLVREREELYHELRSSRPASTVHKTYPVNGLFSMAPEEEEGEKAQIHIQMPIQGRVKECGSRLNHAHFVDPSAVNMEEPPGLFFRRRVLPRSPSS